MHEKSLMDDLMNKIFDLAKREKATKITKVSVTLGALSHMSAQHFQEHFDIAAAGTIAEGAEIEAKESQDIQDPYASKVLLRSIDVS